MPEAIENYISRLRVAEIRRQAFAAWGVFGLVAALWIAAILIAPIAENNQFYGVSHPIYRFFSFICHQMSERSFHIENHQFAVCARCFGIYCGLFFGAAIYPLLRGIENTEPFPRVWLFAAMIPMGIDWSLGFFGIWANTHFSRFTTGAILGTACGLFIIPAIIELFQLLMRRVNEKKPSV